jgi:Heterokaryon incompatibility protein (HET)
LIDCEAYVHRDTPSLRIGEWTPTNEKNSIIENGMPIVDGLKYATISYVWNSRTPSTSDSSFDVLVDKPEDDSRISIDALRIVCEAALQMKLQYIWLDRVCIIQNNEADKDFQLAIMGGIYRHSICCFVLPGGLGKLAGIHDITPWVYRSWTLPEAILPKEVWCIFRWEYGNGNWDFSDTSENGREGGEVYEIETRRKSFAFMTLWGALAVSESRKMDSRADREDPSEGLPFTSYESMKSIFIPSPVLFSKETEPITALLAAIRNRDRTRWQLDDAEQQAVWRCAVMRGASEPLDEVKSLMGLFEVDVTNEAKTETRDELMLTLCQKILAKPGGRPNWLAASVGGPWLNNFSTMPSPLPPPGDDVQVPFLKTEQFKHMRGLAWRLDVMPSGQLSDNGYLALDTIASGIDFRNVHHNIEVDLDRPESPFPGFSAIAEVRFHGDHRWESVSLAGNPGTHALRIGGLGNMIYVYDPESLSRHDVGLGSRTPAMWLVGERTSAGWRRTGTIVAGLWPEISLNIGR